MSSARSYLRYVELSFQVVLHRPWFANRSKRLVRSPKIHRLDVGLWRFVTRRRDRLPGEFCESGVVAEVLKVLDSSRSLWGPQHLRTHDGLEIDLLLTRDEEVILVEIKKADRVTSAHARDLRRVDEVTERRVLLGPVVYRGPVWRLSANACGPSPASCSSASRRNPSPSFPRVVKIFPREAGTFR